MKSKKITDSSEVLASLDIKKKIEEEVVRVRDRFQQVEAALTAVRHTNQPPSALASFRAEANPATIDRDKLCREFQELEQRQRFLDRALTEAQRELDRVRGAASFEICKEARPAFIQAIKRKLAAKKADAEADAELSRLRDELEAQGVKTGSIACAVDNSKERREIYEREVKRDFPELNQ